MYLDQSAASSPAGQQKDNLEFLTIKMEFWPSKLKMLNKLLRLPRKMAQNKEHNKLPFIHQFMG